MKIKILGRHWQLLEVPAGCDPDTVGACDPPWKPRKEIRIRNDLAGKHRLDTIIHELTHAAFWMIDEGYVNQFATDVATVLWQLGYQTTGESTHE